MTASIEHLATPTFIVSVAIAVLAAETALLALLGLRDTRWWRHVPNCLSGLAILVALRIALDDPAPVLIAACLMASLAAHLADMAMRRKSPR